MASAKQNLGSAAAGFSPAVAQAITLGSGAPTGQARKAKEARIATASCETIRSSLVAPKAMVDDLTTIIRDMAGAGIALTSLTVGFTDRDGRFEVKLGVEVVEGHKTSARRKVKLRKVHKVHNDRAIKTHKNWRTTIDTAGPSIAFESRSSSLALRPSSPSKTFLNVIGLSESPESESLTRCLGAFEYGIKYNSKAYADSALAMIKSVSGVAKGKRDKKAITFANDGAAQLKKKIASATEPLTETDIRLLSWFPELGKGLTDEFLIQIGSVLNDIVSSQSLSDNDLIKIGEEYFQGWRLESRPKRCGWCNLKS